MDGNHLNVKPTKVLHYYYYFYIITFADVALFRATCIYFSYTPEQLKVKGLAQGPHNANFLVLDFNLNPSD